SPRRTSRGSPSGATAISSTSSPSSMPISIRRCTSAASPVSATTRPRWPRLSRSRVVSDKADLVKRFDLTKAVSLVGDGLHEDLDVAAQGQPAAADLQQAGGAVAEHLQAGADADAQLGQAGDQGGLAGDVGDLGPFARTKAFQRKEGEGV